MAEYVPASEREGTLPAKATETETPLATSAGAQRNIDTLQNTAGNRAVSPELARRSRYTLDDETIAGIRRDAATIIKEAGASFPNRALIASLVSRWGSKDRALNSSKGSPHLDKLFSILNGTLIPKSSWKTLWLSADVNALTAVIHVMEDSSAMREGFLSDLKLSAAYRDHFAEPEVTAIWQWEAVVATELRDSVEHGSFKPVFDRLALIPEVTDRDDVALALVARLPDSVLRTTAKSAEGRRFLARMVDELSSGSYAGDEARQVERLLTAFESGVDPTKYLEPDNVPVLPVGTLLSGDSFVQARLNENGKIWLKSSYKAEHQQFAKRLPDWIEVTGVEVDLDAVIGIVFVDQDEVPKYLPAIRLLVTSNQQNTETLLKILKYAGAGASVPFAAGAVGSSLVSGVSETAPLLERVVALGIEGLDVGATVIGYLGLFVDEIRPSLIRLGGQQAKDFLAYWDLLQHLTNIYGVSRVAMDLAPVIANADTVLAGLRHDLEQRLIRDRAAGLSTSELEKVESRLAPVQKDFKSLYEKSRTTHQPRPDLKVPKGSAKDAVPPAATLKPKRAGQPVPPPAKTAPPEPVVIKDETHRLDPIGKKTLELEEQKSQAALAPARSRDVPPGTPEAVIADEWLARNRPGPASTPNEARLEIPAPPPPAPAPRPTSETIPVASAAAAPKAQPGGARIGGAAQTVPIKTTESQLKAIDRLLDSFNVPRDDAMARDLREAIEALGIDLRNRKHWEAMHDFLSHYEGDIADAVRKLKEIPHPETFPAVEEVASRAEAIEAAGTPKELHFDDRLPPKEETPRSHADVPEHETGDWPTSSQPRGLPDRPLPENVHLNEIDLLVEEPAAAEALSLILSQADVTMQARGGEFEFLVNQLVQEGRIPQLARERGIPNLRANESITAAKGRDAFDLKYRIRLGRRRDIGYTAEATLEGLTSSYLTDGKLGQLAHDLREDGAAYLVVPHLTPETIEQLSKLAGDAAAAGHGADIHVIVLKWSPP